MNSSIFKTDKLLSQVKFPGDVITDFKDLFSKNDFLKVRNKIPNKELLNLISDKRFISFKEGTLILIEDIDDSVKTIFKDEFERQK